jgi:hypothetical protein
MVIVEIDESSITFAKNPNWSVHFEFEFVGVMCVIHNGTDILVEDGWLPEGDACGFPSLLTSSGLHLHHEGITSLNRLTAIRVLADQKTPAP